MTTALSFLLAAAAGLALGDFSLDDVVAAHESAIGLIHSADVYLETRRKSTGEVIERFRWSLDGAKERVRSERVLQGTDPRRFSDCYLDGRTQYFLSGVDPIHPPIGKKPFDLRGVHGSKSPQTRNQMNMRAADFVLLRPILTANDEKRTLAELIRDSRSAFGPNGAELIGHSIIERHDSFHIRLKHPGVADSETGKTEFRGSQMDIFVDPSVNFHIRRVESRVTNAEGGGWMRAIQAERFNDYGNGVYMAAEVVSEVSSEKGEVDSKHANLVILTSGIVNESLPPDALDFRWPESVMVVNLPSTGGVSKVELMGPDNQVQRTVKDSKEMSELIGSIAADAEARRVGNSRWYVLGFVTIPLAVLVLWFCWFRIRRRASV